MRTPFLAVTASNHVQFAFRFLPAGARYGLTEDVSDRPKVAVYDTRYADDRDESSGFGQLGEFIACYYIEDLLAGNDGLNLHDSIPAWTVDAQSMTVVRAWLRMMVELGEVVTS